MTHPKKTPGSIPRIQTGETRRYTACRKHGSAGIVLNLRTLGAKPGDRIEVRYHDGHIVVCLASDAGDFDDLDDLADL